jgi:hypothetical protein
LRFGGVRIESLRNGIPDTERFLQVENLHSKPRTCREYRSLSA